MWNDLLEIHGYWMLALGCMLEGEAVLIFAGFAANRGLLDPVGVFAVAAVTGFASDQAFFWLGRRRGARVLARWPSIAGHAGQVTRLIDRWHDWVVVAMRFAYGLRVAGPVLVGMSPVPAWRFAAFGALGAVLWALSMTAIGWFFGAAVESILGRIEAYEGLLLYGLVGAAALGWILRYGWKRWRGHIGRKPP